jgi:CRISPR-associated protein Cmr3
MTKQKNYLIKLTPLGPFFFGGKKRSEAETETDYYLKSRFFPQQTAVLGMLRQELLMQNKVFPLNEKNREKTAQLIGQNSFNPEEKENEQDFGVIREISPLFLVKEEKKDHKNKTSYYHTAPRDHGLVLIEKDKNYYFKDYNPKNRPRQLIAHDAPGKGIDMDKFFRPYQQVGIKKDKTGIPGDDAYYKQIFYRLVSEDHRENEAPTGSKVSLAFFLRLDTRWGDNSSETRLESNIIFMGGERSAFKMDLVSPPGYSEAASVQTLFAGTLPDFLPHCCFAKIILTADAFIEPAKLNNFLLKVNSSEFFRNIRTHVQGTLKYSNLARSENNRGEHGDSPYLGRQYNLVTRGSVLYCRPHETEKLCSGIFRAREYANYRKIGYNYYKAVNPTQGKGGME